MKTYKLQKRLASKLLKTGKNRIAFKEDKLTEISEAITRSDVKDLIKKGTITAKKKKGVSRSRAKKRHEQRKKGRRKGYGTRKGRKKARTPKKRAWINKIRPQRELLRHLKDKKVLTPHLYRKLYNLAKAGFFRSRAHLKLYIKKQVKK